MKISVFIFMLFLSGCLLTHKEIKKESAQSTDSKEDQDWLDQESDKETEELSGERQDHKKVTPKKARFLVGNMDVTQKISQIETSLRELRGQIESTDKKQKDRIAQLEQGLLALIQTLDLRVASLANEIKTGKNKKIQKKDEPEKLFQKSEQFFKEENWKSAIIHYEKYREQNKNGEFYEKATFQIGMCFRKLGLKKEANVFFREVVESFPKGDSAQDAKKMLSSSDSEMKKE